MFTTLLLSAVLALNIPEVPDKKFIEHYIRTVAIENEINSDMFFLVALGESGLNLKAKGDYTKKTGYRSFGLWQIQYRIHDTTLDCVYDLVCATDKAIEIWKDNPKQFSCYRELTGEFKSNNCGYKAVDKILD